MSIIKRIDDWLQTGLLGNNGPMEALDEVALESDQNNINSLQQNLNTTMGNTTPVTNNITPVTNNVPPPQPPNFMNGLMNDPERMARMTIALNSMRLDPDPAIATSMENKLESIRKDKMGNKSVAIIRTMANAPNVTEDEKVRLNALADAAETGAMTGSDALAQAMKRQSGGTNISFGDDNKALYDAVGKDLVEQKTLWRERGVSSRYLFEQYSRMEGILARMGETGLDEAFRNEIREKFGGFPLFRDFIDNTKLTDAQELQAVTNQLVLEELRKNKGPQTDFDAIFAGTTLPALKNTKEANAALLIYGKSSNKLISLLGDEVHKAKYSDPEKAVQIMGVIDRLHANAPGVIYREDSESGAMIPTYFQEWYHAENQKGRSATQRLVEWVNIKRELLGQTKINADILYD